jgi:hypothetical protein
MAPTVRPDLTLGGDLTVGQGSAELPRARPPGPGGRSTVRPAMRHSGPCGRRVACWRPGCRAEWAPYATVEVLVDGILARCHGGRYPASDLIARMVAA